MAPIIFGTDGWRAVIAEEFTFANVARVAQATADYWSGLLASRAAGLERCRKLIVVGYDRRFLSDEFARCASGVFIANGFPVVLTAAPTPTPSVSHAVKQLHAVGGVMITASHNPPKFNGYKLKSHFGGPAEPATCSEVEQWLDRNPVRIMKHEGAVASGLLQVRDLRPAHYAAIKKMVDFKLISQSGLRFAHDALFGVGAGCFDALLAGTTCRVTTLNGSHDPLFGGINPEPIPKNYTLGAAHLKKHPHDLCLVTDGDADRVGGMDGRGHPISTHQIICLLLQHLHNNRGLRGRMVKALTTTSMVDKMCAGLDSNTFARRCSGAASSWVRRKAAESGFRGTSPNVTGYSPG